MKKILLIGVGLLAVGVLLYFLWLSKQKEDHVLTETSLPKDTLTNYAELAHKKGLDTSKLIIVHYEDLAEDKIDEFREKGYLRFGNYLSDEYLQSLKEYFTTYVLDTSEIESYGGYGHLKQRYFFYIYNNLPSFVDRKERHNGYFADASMSQGEDKKLLAYSIYRIDRSPQNIRRTFDLFKSQAKDYINMDLYTRLGIKQSIHSLLDSYEYLQTLEKGKLDSVYLAVDSVATHYNYDTPSAYGHSLDSDYGIYMKYLEIEKYAQSHPDTYETIWVFSFWVRRHHEKNEEEVYKILKELRDIYEVEN